MDEKSNAAVTVSFLALILLFFTVADLMGSNRLYSETENRMLAVKPEFSWKPCWTVPIWRITRLM